MTDHVNCLAAVVAKLTSCFQARIPHTVNHASNTDHQPKKKKLQSIFFETTPHPERASVFPAPHKSVFYL
jgi:hypothetical protein